MKQWLIGLFLNKWVRRLAGMLAAALLVYVPELDVSAATEVFTQILSGLVVFIVGKAETQPETIRKIDVKKP